MSEKLKRAMQRSHREKVPSFPKTLAEARARRKKKRIFYGFGIGFAATAAVALALSFLPDDADDTVATSEQSIAAISEKVVPEKSVAEQMVEPETEYELEDFNDDDDGVLIVAEWESPTDFLLNDSDEFDAFGDDLFGLDMEEL